MDDDTLIHSLNESKKITEDIFFKLESAKVVEERIEHHREHYFPFAKNATTLFFTISDLNKLDPMYQYSLKWFTTLFIKSFSIGEKKLSIVERVP